MIIQESGIKQYPRYRFRVMACSPRYMKKGRVKNIPHPITWMATCKTFLLIVLDIILLLVVCKGKNLI